MSWDTRPPTVRRAAISFSIERPTAVGNALRSEHSAVRVRTRLYAVMYIHAHVHIGTRARHRDRARTRVLVCRGVGWRETSNARGDYQGGRGEGGDTNGSLNSTRSTRELTEAAILLGDYLAISTELRRNRLTHALRTLRVRYVAVGLEWSYMNNNVVTCRYHQSDYQRETKCKKNMEQKNSTMSFPDLAQRKMDADGLM